MLVQCDREELHTISLHQALCIWSSRLTGQHTAFLIHSKSAVYIIHGEVDVITEMQTLLEHYLSLSPLKSR